MNTDELIKILEASFPPYRCKAELNKHSYGTKIGFRVYGSDNKEIMTVNDLQVAMIISEGSLASIITSTKQEIKRRGYLIA